MKEHEDKGTEKYIPPPCPYCGVQMREARYIGYYDDFDYWECDCQSLPNSNKNKFRGQFA